jgi:hypothetical protein
MELLVGRLENNLLEDASGLVTAHLVTALALHCFIINPWLLFHEM